jgi:Na+/proline symporter
MSTISTQLNWGTSYVVNDFYRRFLQPNRDEHHYVWIARVTTITLMLLSAIVTFYLESIRQAWEFVLESGAGIGLVLILRWYWWRINAWSEIAAMVGAAVGYAALKMFTALVFPYTLLAVVGWTTLCWLVVTFATAPESDEHLVRFYRRTHPDGPGWTRIAALAGGPPPGSLGSLAVDWIAGVVLIYAVLFGIGELLLGSIASSLKFFAAAAAAAALISADLSRRGWKTLTE